ncbi:hypothetical protein PISS_b0236 [Pseudoalteromonas issachenkonii]|uniref:Uncharacterized protein n=1 Tax=Pseudoalteromonas issachenkonii TaxID=152297 RepID=A0ABM6N8A3_9GAMM|nr:hypothetical protein PISS_b0236 [Pseudoalteromonas issachenkonii]
MFFKLPAGQSNSGTNKVEEETADMCAPYIEPGSSRLHE